MLVVTHSVEHGKQNRQRDTFAKRINIMKHRVCPERSMQRPRTGRIQNAEVLSAVNKIVSQNLATHMCAASKQPLQGLRFVCAQELRHA